MRGGQLQAVPPTQKNSYAMSDEIKSAGVKGYVVMGAAIALLLFVILVVFVYKYNNNFVPESPELYGFLSSTLGNGLA